VLLNDNTDDVCRLGSLMRKLVMQIQKDQISWDFNGMKSGDTFKEQHSIYVLRFLSLF